MERPALNPVATVLCLAATFQAGCHSGRDQIATAPRTAAECADVVAPSRGDSLYRKLVPPMVVVPVAGANLGRNEVYTFSANVRVNRSGQVDSVILLNSTGGGDVLVAHRLALAKARPARFLGCPVTAWTVVDLP